MTSDPDVGGTDVRVARDRRTSDARRTGALLTVLVLLVALTVWRLGAGGTGALFEVRGASMGTTYVVQVDADVSPSDAERIRALVGSRLEEVERLLSTWDSASELSRFNRHRSGEPFPLDGKVLEVLGLAREVSEASDGAFDVTVAPLVDAWGFGSGPGPSQGPGEPELAVLRRRVGFRSIRLDEEKGTASKVDPEVIVDVSGVGKGYAVEWVAAGLRELGFDRHLVEIGGELKAGAARRDGARWRVGIERPDEGVRTLYAIVEVVDLAVATSGDYRRFRDDGGERRTHLVDPRTGHNVPFRGASVTVFHAHAAVADAWATALAVLGPEEAYELARKEAVAALFVVRSEGGLTFRSTPAFRESAVVLHEVDTP